VLSPVGAARCGGVRAQRVSVVGISQIQPECIRVGANGSARVLVRGRGLGMLFCQGARRFVIGRFIEGFVVDAEQRPIVIRFWGLTGRQQVEIPVQWTGNVLYRRVASRLRQTHLEVPKTKRVIATLPRYFAQRVLEGQPTSELGESAPLASSLRTHE
jgi:hypothetical protein